MAKKAWKVEIVGQMETLKFSEQEVETSTKEIQASKIMGGEGSDQ